MENEELIEILKSFDNKKVEQLDEKARNLFYAIMSIADERDEYKKIIEEINEYIENNKYDIETTFRIQSKEFLEENITTVVPSLKLLDILNKTNKE